MDLNQETTYKLNFKEIISHLSELRSRVLKVLLFFLIAFILLYYLSDYSLLFFTKPLLKLLPNNESLYLINLADGFLVHLKISFWLALLISAPIAIYQIWAFVAPALFPTEKKIVLPLTFMGSILFFSGCALAYFLVLPIMLKFFLSFTESGYGLKAAPSIGSYITLIYKIVLPFGFVFQMPLILIFLNKIGLIEVKQLRSGRKYAILIIFIIAAILTPPDVVSQLILAFPMLLLYELSIIALRLNKKKKK